MKKVEDYIDGGERVRVRYHYRDRMRKDDLNWKEWELIRGWGKYIGLNNG